MNVFGIGSGELLLILLIVLLVMGPERIPHLARQWGKFVRVLSRFTRTWQEISAEINRQINLEELNNPTSKPKPTPPPTRTEPDDQDNTIAPPDKQQPAGGEEDTPPPSDLPAKSVMSDSEPTSSEPPS